MIRKLRRLWWRLIEPLSSHKVSPSSRQPLALPLQELKECRAAYPRLEKPRRPVPQITPELTPNDNEPPETRPATL
jgi:hypothetical protein